MKALLGPIAALVLLMGLTASPAVAGGNSVILSIDDLTDVITFTTNIFGSTQVISVTELPNQNAGVAVSRSGLPGTFSAVNEGFNIFERDGVTLSDLLRLQVSPGTQPGTTNLVFSFTSEGENGPPLIPFTGSLGETVVNLAETGLFQVVYNSIAPPNDLTVQFRSDVEAVPEPASLTLFGTALLGFGVIRRRRKRGMQASA